MGDKQAGSDINDTNGKEFDIGDENVVTRDESNFAKVSKDDSIEVPYEIFKAYVAALYDRHNDNGDLILYVSSTQRDGLGISTSGTMKEIYWQYQKYAPINSHNIGAKMAEASGYKLTDVPYESSFAGYKDWFLQKYRRPSYTVEAGIGESPLPLSQFNQIYNDNIGILIIGAAV